MSKRKCKKHTVDLSEQGFVDEPFKHCLTSDQQFEMWKILNKQFNPTEPAKPGIVYETRTMKAELELYQVLTMRFYCNFAIVRVQVKDETEKATR